MYICVCIACVCVDLCSWLCGYEVVCLVVIVIFVVVVVVAVVILWKKSAASGEPQ